MSKNIKNLIIQIIVILPTVIISLLVLEKTKNYGFSILIAVGVACLLHIILFIIKTIIKNNKTKKDKDNKQNDTDK